MPQPEQGIKAELDERVSKLKQQLAEDLWASQWQVLDQYGDQAAGPPILFGGLETALDIGEYYGDT